MNMEKPLSYVEESLRIILQQQSELKQLALDGVEGNLKDYIKSLSVPCKLLSIFVANGITVTDTCLESIVKACPFLEDLIMFEVGDSRDDSKFANVGVLGLLTGLANSLRRLEVGGSWNYGYYQLNTTMFPTQPQSTTLKEVCLGQLNGLNDEGLSALIRYAPNIEFLIIEGSSITK
jgi:hypothetical protein